METGRGLCAPERSEGTPTRDPQTSQPRGQIIRAQQSRTNHGAPKAAAIAEACDTPRRGEPAAERAQQTADGRSAGRAHETNSAGNTPKAPQGARRNAGARPRTQPARRQTKRAPATRRGHATRKACCCERSERARA